MTLGHLLTSFDAPAIQGVLADITPAYWQSTLIKVLVFAALVPTAAMVFAVTFLFKVMAWMQSRYGPMEAGIAPRRGRGWGAGRGELQLIAEALKWLQKEDLIPDTADKIIFKLSPFIILTSTFLLYAAIPSGPGAAAVGANIPGGVFFLLAISSVSVIGVLMAGWASSNKYALLGGIRAAGQLIAYELPMVLAVVGIVILAGSFNLQDIVLAQKDFKVWFIPLPFIVAQLPLFFIFLAAVQAELTQSPFDMPVAESELVAGYQVEYSGIRFLIFFLAEFSTAFAFAAIAATLFLGGWYLPIGLPLDNPLWYVLGPIFLLTKVMIVAFLIFWARFTYPRFREDQLQKAAWKYLIPLSLIWISLTAIAVVVWK
jgi:NADH-quinone oxidoreductase subunit H